MVDPSETYDSEEFFNGHDTDKKVFDKHMEAWAEAFAENEDVPRHHFTVEAVIEIRYTMLEPEYPDDRV